MKRWTSEECLIGSYKLYAYAEYVETERVREENVLDWAESSIWYIVSGKMDNYGSTYDKWQKKYFSAVQECPISSEILKVKGHAEARVKSLNGKHARVMKMAEILNSLARKR